PVNWLLLACFLSLLLPCLCRQRLPDKRLSSSIPHHLRLMRFYVLLVQPNRHDPISYPSYRVRRLLFSACFVQHKTSACPFQFGRVGGDRRLLEENLSCALQG